MPYTPHTWVDDETITATRLNAIETGIQAAAGAVSATTTVAISPTAAITTSSTSFVDITGLTMSVTTEGGDLYIPMAGSAGQINNASHSTVYAIHVNGTDYPITAVRNTTTPAPWGGHTVVKGLAAGTYTVKGRFRATDPSLTATALLGSAGQPGYARLSCIEHKR